MRNKKIYPSCVDFFVATLLVSWILFFPSLYAADLRALGSPVVAMKPDIEIGLIKTMVENSKTSQTKLYPVTPGNWGGSGIGVTIEKKAVKIQYDCAEGELRGPLKTDKAGNFKVEGLHTRHAFGPIRLNNLPKAEPALFEGKITGKVMKFKVTLIKTNEIVGEFTLERGKTGRLHRCA